MSGNGDLGKIKTLLIANRGEIAMRITRTAQRLGIKVIAVFTDVEQNAPYVRLADKAVNIGAGPVAESYLNSEKLVQTALNYGADAIHPGYGFLSENDAFAQATRDAGLTFIGPSCEVIAKMGDKAQAKLVAQDAGLPVLEGYEGQDQSLDGLMHAACALGFPIMIKAAHGGGGRGMRIANSKETFAQQLQIAQQEAQLGFGNSDVILERYIETVRHVEVQIFADQFGSVVHLGERDCSLQRRHQKVIEEAPVSGLALETCEALHTSAVQLATAIGYEGAGTVEFLVTQEGSYYFLEMNTRLQVEHPVSEEITGLDFVEWQLSIAAGQPLPLRQDEIAQNGHAIEVRLCAEEPVKGFMPCIGRIEHFDVPQNIRVESGIRAGQDVSPFFDNLLAKLIATGETRDEARARMVHALEQLVVIGLPTNRAFLLSLLKSEAFESGAVSTEFIAQFLSQLPNMRVLSRSDIAIGAYLLYRDYMQKAFQKSLLSDQALLGWSSSGSLMQRFIFEQDEDDVIVVIESKAGHINVTVDQDVFQLEGEGKILRLNGKRSEVSGYQCGADGIAVSKPDADFSLCLKPHVSQGGGASSENSLCAPFHGAVKEIFVNVGDTVKKGQVAMIFEAMKLQHELVLSRDGRVEKIHVEEGQNMSMGAEMLTLAQDG